MFACCCSRPHGMRLLRRNPTETPTSETLPLQPAAQLSPCHLIQVLALGLLDDPNDKRAIGLCRRAEALHRFLLSQLDKEAKDPVLPPPAPLTSTGANKVI